jgi:hypothetical protein
MRYQTPVLGYDKSSFQNTVLIPAVVVRYLFILLCRLPRDSIMLHVAASCVCACVCAHQHSSAFLSKKFISAVYGDLLLPHSFFMSVATYFTTLPLSITLHYGTLRSVNYIMVVTVGTAI